MLYRGRGRMRFGGHELFREGLGEGGWKCDIEFLMGGGKDA